MAVGGERKRGRQGRKKKEGKEGGEEGRKMGEGKGPNAVTLLGWGGLHPSPVSKFPIGSADDGHAPQLGESWYPEKTCSALCTCSVHGNITCSPTSCKANHVCLRQEGLLRCAAGKRVHASRDVPSVTRGSSPGPPHLLLTLLLYWSLNIIWPYLKDLRQNSNCHPLTSHPSLVLNS